MAKTKKTSEVNQAILLINFSLRKKSFPEQVPAEMQRLVGLAFLNEHGILQEITLALNYTTQASCKHTAMLFGLIVGKQAFFHNYNR